MPIILINKNDYRYDILKKIKFKKYNSQMDETCKIITANAVIILHHYIIIFYQR